MARFLTALAALTLAAAPAAADERRAMVTAFDRVRVEGPFAVDISTGASPAAIATGASRALDGVEMRVEDRTLIVRGSVNDAGGWPGERLQRPTIRVTTLSLGGVTVMGAGRVRIDTMRSADVAIRLTGSGQIEVADIQADRLEASVVGSGALRLSGTALTANMLNNGVGTIEAAGLSVRDLTLQSESGGDSRAHATRTANATALGMGGITITGPAACTRAGPGTISCGK
ncbi:GIN domain-containing protein [Sphingomonas sp. IW22]|uniref:GIN domain-containing protein n=1 Tax=Sphingomonas sp. IW22 TaxID=3242489 RepID=UPI00352122A4